MKRLMIGLPLAGLLSLFAVQATLAWPDDTQASLSTSPAGTTAGGTWTVDISFVSQGHILRVDSLQPSVVIKNVATGERRSFSTEATAESGVWQANVVFPSEGSWTYSVVVGVSGITFDYPPVSIGPALAADGRAAANAPIAAEAPTPGVVFLPIALLAAAAVVAAGLVVARRSMRQSTTAVVEHAASLDRR